MAKSSRLQPGKRSRGKSSPAAVPPDPALPPKQRAFLGAYVESGSVAAAARAAGVHRTTHYEWWERDAAYREAFAQARERLADLLVDEAFRRALEGSDRLLEFLLKGLRPEVFNRHRVEVSPGGPGVGTLAVWQMSDADLEAEIDRYRKVLDR